MEMPEGADDMGGRTIDEVIRDAGMHDNLHDNCHVVIIMIIPWEAEPLMKSSEMQVCMPMNKLLLL